MTCDLFWQEIARKCRLGLELDEGQFDLLENKRDKSCLGTAFTSELRAYTLVLVEMDEEARFYLENIREHSIAAFENDESYVFHPIGGKNIFGKYMSLRIAGMADWALGGCEHDELIRRSIGFLEEAIQIEYEAVFSEAEPVEVGSLCMLYGLLSDWGRICSITEAWSAGIRRRKASKWTDILEALVELAQSGGYDQRKEYHQYLLDMLFSEVTNQEQLGEIYDPRFTINDILSIARIRSETLFGIREPWKVIRSIRLCR